MNKVWLITGSANGLGRSLAEVVLERGDDLSATARQSQRLDDLKQRYADRVRLIDLDVTDAAAGQAAIDATMETFGRIDVLVNNAGFAHVSPFEQTTAEDFRAQVDTNFYGVVNLTRAVIPIMRRQRSGLIVNISSSSGRFGAPGVSAYTAAKWAVSGFTESIAQEVAPFGVRAIAVEPGSIRTNWTRIARGNTPSTLLAEYEPTIGMIMKMTEDFAGHEPGDPAKVAGVIFDLSRRDDLPQHLVLGSDAISRIAAVEEARAEAASKWEQISRSTDFS